MAVIDIPDRSAVGGHIATETPFFPEDFIQQQIACRTWFIPEAVVGSHHRICLSVTDQGFEGREVSIIQVTFAAPGVEAMPVGLGAAVDGIMLGCCNDFEIAGIISLQSFHKSNSDTAGEERIFPIGFLPASPAGIPENVDVWRPERQPLVNPAFPLR